MRIAVTTVCALLLPWTAGCSREPAPSPATDLHLVEVVRENGGLRLGPPQNLTDSESWDNQPAFLPDGTGFLYASRSEGQSDIYRYDLATGAATRLTATPEREYSPMPLPGGGGFSAIRVEQDDRRRLWRFDERGGNPAVLLEWAEYASYYAWVDSELVALYVEGPPSRLTFADIPRGWAEPVPLAEDVGRTVRLVPGRNAISFVHRLTGDEWWITEVDLLLRRPTRLVLALPGCEDFAWLPSGELLMAQGSRVYAWTRDAAAGWEQIADYGADGLSAITRIAVAPAGDRLVLVAERPAPAG